MSAFIHLLISTRLTLYKRCHHSSKKKRKIIEKKEEKAYEDDAAPPLPGVMYEAGRSRIYEP